VEVQKTCKMLTCFFLFVEDSLLLSSSLVANFLFHVQMVVEMESFDTYKTKMLLYQFIFFFFFFFSFLFFSFLTQGAIVGFHQCPTSSSLWEVFLMRKFLYFLDLRPPPWRFSIKDLS
jgi:uncharacterized protein with PQ loop repeat